MKRDENTAAPGFLEQMRELGHNYQHMADDLERQGTRDFLGYTLATKFGEEYREHEHHFRCTVDTEGHVVGACSTQDARLFLQARDSDDS